MFKFNHIIIIFNHKNRGEVESRVKRQFFVSASFSEQTIDLVKKMHFNSLKLTAKAPKNGGFPSSESHFPRGPYFHGFFCWFQAG